MKQYLSLYGHSLPI